jgi:hypothetical protein
MSDNHGSLYAGALGAYDDYSEYMMTSGLGGVGQVDGDGVNNNSNNNSNNTTTFFGAEEQARAPGPTSAGARAFKKARTEEGGEDGERKKEAVAATETETPHDAKRSASIQPGHGQADNRGGNEHRSDEEGLGRGVDNNNNHEEEEEAEMEDNEDEDEDPQAAEFREHTQGELERVCSTLQACLQELAAEFMGYYRASVQVKQVYEQVLAKERAESRRLDMLEPQVKLLKQLVQSTAGMGAGTGIGGSGGPVASTAMARSTPGAKPTAPMQGHPRQPQALRLHAQQSMRHPSHSK